MLRAWQTACSDKPNGYNPWTDNVYNPYILQQYHIMSSSYILESAVQITVQRPKFVTPLCLQITFGAVTTYFPSVAPAGRWPVAFSPMNLLSCSSLYCTTTALHPTTTYRIYKPCARECYELIKVCVSTLLCIYWCLSIYLSVYLNNF